MELASQTMEYHTQALELMDMPLGTAMGAMNWAEVGFCALAMGDVERASELFHKGLTMSTAMKYLARPQLLVGSAFVELAKGRSDEAAKLVHEARQFVEERAMNHLYAIVAFAGAQRGYVNRCVNDIRRRPSQPLIQWRFHPHTVHRGRRLRSTQGPSDA